VVPDRQTGRYPVGSKPFCQLAIILPEPNVEEHTVLDGGCGSFSVLRDPDAVIGQKKGAFNLAEQQQVLRPVIWLLKRYKLVIIDREFHCIESGGRAPPHLLYSVKRQYNLFAKKKITICLLDTIPVQPGIHLSDPEN